MKKVSREERRTDYHYFLTIPTRWQDVDMYSHVNNIIFYAFFDTVIGDYLVRAGGLDYANGDFAGFAVETHCHFLKPVRFPDVLDVGLRAGKLGNTSCRYELGVFRQPDEEPCAVGYFVHVYVDRVTTRPIPIAGKLREALEKLVVLQ